MDINDMLAIKNEKAMRLREAIDSGVFGAEPQDISPHDGLNFGQRIMSSMGLYTPFQRFLFGFTAAETVMWVTKPSFSFDSKGNARSIRLSLADKNGTFVPWFLPGLLVGGAMAVLL